MSDTAFQIGQRLVVIPIATDGRRWRAECSSLPESWSCDLVHRSETELVPNQPLSGWLLWIDHARRYVQASDSNFGFLPISDRMRPRYVASLRLLAALLKGKRDATKEDADALSEVKGMFSRCARRDQWDWRAVQLALGEPSIEAATVMATRLGDTASALRKSDIESARVNLRSLGAGDLARTADAAAVAIEASVPRLQGARGVAGRGRQSQDTTQGAAPFVWSRYSKERLDAANATHAELVRLLGEVLGSYGHRVDANQFVDAFTRLKSGPAIFEAKSLTDDNELAQVRQGLSQLYEYRFRHAFVDASLWLLLSRPLREGWLLTYLQEDRGIHVIWPDGSSLAGPSVARLLESGSDAKRRRGQAES